MESALCATMPMQTQMHMALFKTLNRQFATRTQSAVAVGPLLRLNYNRNSASPILQPVRLRCVSTSAAAASSGGGDLSPDDAIVLRVEGMMCEGCANNVKKLLESRPQVSSAIVNLSSEIAIVSAVAEEKAAPNWHKQLGEALAQHLTNCGFNSTLRGDSD